MALSTFIRTLHDTISGMILKGAQLDINLDTIPEDIDVLDCESVVNAIGEDIARLILLRQINIKIGNQIKAEVRTAKDRSIQALVAAGKLRYNAQTKSYNLVEVSE